jgi:predicted TIM-barrel fold metal-dependent hydrolase
MAESAMAKLDRRTFIAAAGVAAQSVTMGRFARAAESNGTIPIIDAHIHLFDPNRPQGTPADFPGPTGKSGSFPTAYKRLSAPLGVVGAVHIEASDWVEDNLWALETCAGDDIMVGAVGNLNPQVPQFGEYLERYHRNPMFRGIRYGNIWGYDLVGQSKNRVVLDRLKLLAQADLVMDSATPNIALLQALIRVTDAVPELRIVIDHLPGFDPPPEAMAVYDGLLREFKQRPSVFVKLSQIIHPVNGKVSTSVLDYKAKLDHVAETFGEDRVLFGSDYPNSDSWSPVDNVFRVAKEYYASKSIEAAEKYFWGNSLRAYKWIKRTPDQRRLA